MFNDPGSKPNKIKVAKSNEFCNRLIKLCLEDTYIETYSAHNESKFIAVERFLRTVKTKFTNI